MSQLKRLCLGSPLIAALFRLQDNFYQDWVYKATIAEPYQCSKTMLKGYSRFHLSPPRGVEPGSLVTGSKQVVYWTSETW
jgi:hypothetical protein